MSGASERRWGFMRRWCAPICGKLRIRRLTESCAKVPSYRCAGVEMVLPKVKAEATPTKLNAIREALVLLSLIARVNYSAFQYVLAEYCGMEVMHQRICIESDEFMDPQFVLNLEGSEDDIEWVSEMLKSLLSGSDSAPSFHFAGAGEQILSNEVLLLEPVDIRVIVVVNPNNSGSSTMINKVLSALCTNRELESGWCFPIELIGSQFPSCLYSPTCRLVPICRFVIEKIALYFDTYPTLVKVGGSPNSVMKLNTGGFTPGDEMLELDKVDAILSGRHFGKLFRQLLCEDHVKLGFDHVKVSSLVSHPQLFAQLCTAAWATQTTTSLHLHFDDMNGIVEMDEWMWMQMGYALFDSHSSVTHLVLEQVELTKKYVKEMARVLRADDPVRFLFSSEDEQPPGPRYSSLSRGTLLTIQQMHPDEVIDPALAMCQLEADVDTVRVIDVFETERGAALASVLVPGYGLCHVSSASLLQANKLPFRRGSGVTSLSLDFVDEPGFASGLSQLLQLIGDPIERLKLTLPTGTRLELEDILAFCPNLKALTVEGTSVTVAALINSKMQLEELDCNFTDLHLLVRELANRESRLAQTLKRAALRIPYSWVGRDKPIVFMAVDAMLKRNRVLEFVHVLLPGAQAVSGTPCHHNEPLPVAARPFPLACRLAFLSVFVDGAGDAKKRAKRSSSAAASKPPPSLAPNDHVLGIIFEFAAECVHRKVFFESANV